MQCFLDKTWAQLHVHNTKLSSWEQAVSAVAVVFSIPIAAAAAVGAGPCSAAAGGCSPPCIDFCYVLSLTIASAFLQQLRQWAPSPNVPQPLGANSLAFAPPGGPPAADSRPLGLSLAAGRGRRGCQLDITNLPGLEALTAKVGTNERLSGRKGR